MSFASTPAGDFRDVYGNSYLTSSWPQTVTASATFYPQTYHPQTYNWHISPNISLLSTPEIIDKLIEKMVTLYKPGDRLVVCVDSDLTPAQAQEFADTFHARGIDAVIIRGARAGTGRPVYAPVKPEHERIDILARIAEVWERRPDLSLAELLGWWRGEDMTNDEFAAATDVYFRKIYEVMV